MGVNLCSLLLSCDTSRIGGSSAGSKSKHWYLFHDYEITTFYSPHMKKLYGDSLRKDAGFVKVMKSVASKNVQILEKGAQRHAPELRRVVKEVKGTFEKVFEETADVVEEFLAKCEHRGG